MSLAARIIFVDIAVVGVPGIPAHSRKAACAIAEGVCERSRNDREGNDGGSEHDGLNHQVQCIEEDLPFLRGIGMYVYMAEIILAAQCSVMPMQKAIIHPGVEQTDLPDTE